MMSPYGGGCRKYYPPSDHQPDEPVSDQDWINEGPLENREVPRVTLTREQLHKIYDYVSLKIVSDRSSLTGILREDRSDDRWGGYVYRALEHFAVLS